MASLIKDRSGNYLVSFRWGGRQFTRALDTQDDTLATAGVAKVEETLMRLKRGWATMPAEAEPGIFIVSGGQLITKPVVESPEIHNTLPEAVCLSGLFDLYV